MSASPRIRLASRSPRRAELLRQISVPFVATPAEVDETPLPGESAHAFVQRMAEAKAAAVWTQYKDLPVLGSDTAVVLDGRILGKPVDREDAIAMLMALSGRSHQVLTGVALQQRNLEYVLSESRVTFRPVEPEEAHAYWDSGEPGDKAGGYAVQGLAAVFIERIEGSYSGIMGLPLFETSRLIADL